MKKIIITATIILYFFQVATSQKTQDSRPNIVIIFMDDMVMATRNAITGYCIIRLISINWRRRAYALQTFMRPRLYVQHQERRCLQAVIQTG